MFRIPEKALACGDARLHNPTVIALWSRFALGRSTLEVTPGEANTFLLGDAPLPALPADSEYALTVTDTGAAVVGRDYNGLARGLSALMMQMEHKDGVTAIAPTAIEGRYRLKNRMIHLCVFPENDLTYLQKLVRLCGLCQYTHVVLEFWGMLQYDCLKELAWPHAFTKAQMRELLAEARALGMEPVPMVNSLGHATASRLCYGKHVVLDQNPALEELFTPDGWAWNIENPAAIDLLRQVRQELYELFGEGDYIHIGIDEAYYISNCQRLRRQLPDYLRDLTAAVAAEGRRPMLWMDMLLEGNTDPGYYATADATEAATLRAALHPSSVMVDWQYDADEAPIKTLLTLKDSGYDVLGAPWLRGPNYKAHIDTIEQEGLFGLMLTTWHTLSGQMIGIPGCAALCGARFFPWKDFSDRHTLTATLLRRVSFADNGYADAGWHTTQIDY